MRDPWIGTCKTPIGRTSRLDAAARRLIDLARTAAEMHEAMVGVSASQGCDADTSSPDAGSGGEVTVAERLALLES